jgi:hypothetical protein
MPRVFDRRREFRHAHTSQLRRMALRKQRRNRIPIVRSRSGRSGPRGDAIFRGGVQ